MSVYLAADQLLQLTNQNRLIDQLRAEVAALEQRIKDSHSTMAACFDYSDSDAGKYTLNEMIHGASFGYHEQTKRAKRAEAEVAALRARPAMAWRRREEGEELEHGSHLAMVRGSVKIHAIDYRGGQYVTNGRTFEDVRKVTHYIPWSDLMPPGGEDAS